MEVVAQLTSDKMNLNGDIFPEKIVSRFRISPQTFTTCYEYDFCNGTKLSKQQLLILANRYKKNRVPVGGRKQRKSRLRKKQHKYLLKFLGY